MKTIQQLAKLARRIPRVVSRNMKKLTDGRRLTPAAANLCRAKIAGAHIAQKLLVDELVRRNVGGKPFRDATPHKLRPKPTTPVVVGHFPNAEHVSVVSALMNRPQPGVVAI